MKVKSKVTNVHIIKYFFKKGRVKKQNPFYSSCLVLCSTIPSEETIISVMVFTKC